MVTRWPTACRVHVHFVRVQEASWDCRPKVDRRPGVWMASGLARCLQGRSSSTHVPDNVSESHTAARPFPGHRDAWRPDVPDNRPLSDGRVGRPGPLNRKQFRMGHGAPGWWMPMSRPPAVMMLPRRATTHDGSGRSSGWTSGVPSASRHSRTEPSPSAITGLPSRSTPKAIALAVAAPQFWDDCRGAACPSAAVMVTGCNPANCN